MTFSEDAGRGYSWRKRTDRPGQTKDDPPAPASEGGSMDSGYIEVIPARDLRVGDVFSTDGGIVVHVGISDVYPGVYVETVCHGIGKDGVLDPEFPCPLWRENES